MSTPSKKSNIFIYGKHPVIAALCNPKRHNKKLYTTKTIWQEIQKKIPQSNIDLNLLEAPQLNKIFQSEQNHQNIVLETTPLPSLEIEDILLQASLNKTSCLIILDQITDPHNIGAIIRSAAAFSADAIILPLNNSPKENSTILKCAAGAFETIPMVHVVNLANCIKTLKQEGYWVVGLDASGNSELGAKVFSNKTAIILGSEDDGMRKLTKEKCDFLAKIPISNQLNSLNVSNAAAIALHEYAKYRLEI